MKTNKIILIRPLIVAGLLIALTGSCKKEDDPIPYTEGTVTDIEGNVYKTIQIEIPDDGSKGVKAVQSKTQTWMAENLKTTRYSNGDLIETSIPATRDIYNESMPKYQWAYEGNESYADIYGRLYTWFAATDSRNICPTGWHVPSHQDWINLVLFVGGIHNGYESDRVAGGKLKETGTAHWLSPNTGATNSIGFSALPGGVRWDEGSSFNDLYIAGKWWTSTEDPDRWKTYAWCWGAWYTSAGSNPSTSEASMGYSIRCIKD
jgi:uncharacterized protein (TIGR02145 family)